MGFLLAALLLASTAYARDIKCAPGLQIFVARGTNEPPGPGASGLLAEAVVDKIPGSAFEAIDYPASDEDPVYFDSVRNGTDAVRQSLIDYSGACPDGKISLFGYSQGAQVTANALSGTTIAWSPYPESLKNLDSLDARITKNIVAVALFGDPTLSPNAKYRKGTADVNRQGIFHRQDPSGLDALGDRLVSYCDTGDVFCDAGSDPNIPAHLHYLENYSTEILDFIVRQYEGGAPDSSPSATPGDAQSGAMRRARVPGW
ncbi:related to acetylxylan esterase precursor [Cephalotrichum gorgonifer]|uniref:Related to acetylxylan esterase n=1 Tax=Cephalotrichum gorgonifer TaxID=2041049 RepID=A0AAE8N6N3_9PEZI|nr:related to acetylxylan esterase precursor [Cephalotrichum gorgonifer]